MSQPDRHEDEMNPVADAHVGQAIQDQPVPREPAKLPTIIVDPSLTAPSQQEAPASAAQQARLSVDDAERFASSFRPSWEPAMAPAPQAEGGHANGPVASAPPAPAAPAAGPVQDVVEAQMPIDLASIASKRRTAMLGGGVVLAFAALVALAWFTTHSGAPDTAEASTQGASATHTTTPPADNSEPSESPAQSPPSAQAAEPPSVAQTTLAEPSAPAALAEPIEPALAQPIEQPAPVEPTAVPPEPSQEPPPSAEQLEAAGTATNEVEETAAPKPEPAPAVAKGLRLQASAQPREATLTLDGASISNPYEATLPRGDRHVLQASAPGYETQSIALTMTRNRAVVFRLERERPPRAAQPKRRAAERPASKPAKGAGFVEESPY